MSATERRQRLDVLLVERALSPSRERARAVIMAGAVRVNGKRSDKAGTMVAEDAVVEVIGPPLRYVSRGGLKLEHALIASGLSPSGRICLDVGASTGGFTDCLLQHGALHVYAIDVGYGQLDTRLRSDPRVTSCERVNARYLEASHVPEPASFVVADVSFISLQKVLPAILARTTPQADIVLLVKPQFEAGRSEVGKGGVVRSAEVHRRVLRDTIRAVSALSLQPAGLVASPISGPAGNVEFLLWCARSVPSPAADAARPPEADAARPPAVDAARPPEASAQIEGWIDAAVRDAHSLLARVRKGESTDAR